MTKQEDQRRLGGNRVLGKSRGSRNLAIRLCAAMARFLRPNSDDSFSVGGATLQPSSWKYCDILNRSVSHYRPLENQWHSLLILET